MNIKNILLISLLIVAALGGALTQYIYPQKVGTPIDLIFALLGSFLSFIWYRIDSNQLSFKRTKLLNVGIIVLGILFFPIYFIKSRGYKIGLFYSLFFIVFVVCWVACSALGTYLVYQFIQS